MPIDLSSKLIVAISSRALFDLDESHQVYESQGVDAYAQYQIQNEEKPLAPGVAFPLAQKLLNLRHPETQQSLVEVILLSRNSADTGLRIFNSIQYHKLNIIRAAFTSGESPYRYVQAFHSHLFLSADAEDVTHALKANCAAARIYLNPPATQSTNHLNIAFDGDAVLFSDEAERIYQTQGLEAFTQREIQEAKTPLPGGPFKGFLAAVHEIQRLFSPESCPLRTALITARGAPTHERVIRTLRAWNIRIDEAVFLGGLSKGEFLKAFQADIFFDDQPMHCHDSSQHVATGQVHHGICAVDTR